MKKWKQPKSNHSVRGPKARPGVSDKGTSWNSSPVSLDGDSVEPRNLGFFGNIRGREQVWGYYACGARIIPPRKDSTPAIPHEPQLVEPEYVDEGVPVEEELFEPDWEDDEEKIGRAVSEDEAPVSEEVEEKPAKVSSPSWPIALLPATVSGTDGMISENTFGMFQEADEKFSFSHETPQLHPRRESPVSQREPFPRSASRFRLLEIIEQNRPLPSPSLLLGVCDDFLPLLVDLFDPSPGSILLMGDDDEDNRGHLRSIIASACLLNQNEQLDLSVISPFLDAVLPRNLASEVLNRVNPEQEEAFTLLDDFFLLAEKRGKNPQDKQINILAIDQLDVLIDRLAPESLSYLRWLIQKGPHAHIWTIASISSKRAMEIDWKTIKSFGTHLIGKVTDPVILKSLLGPQSACQRESLPKNQAIVKLGEEIVPFFVPQI